VGSWCGAWTQRSIVARYRRTSVALAAAALFLAPIRARAQDRFRAEIFGGSAWSIPTTLTIDQSGEERLSFRAHWETRPFEDAPYYAVRVALWGGRRGWELQLLHHKIYLTNPPPEIDYFEVSHGWNILTIQRAIRGRLLDWRAGAGAVITHTEGRIRGREVDPGGGIFGGYHLSGAGALVGAGKSFSFSRRFFATAEGQLTFSAARIPIRTGHVRTANVAFHVLFGLGFGI
jgi:hypothetical protein